MWSRRIALTAAVLPLALLVTWDAPERVEPAEPGPAQAEPRQREPETAPRPGMVRRAAWRADEELVREAPTYTGAAKVVFVHHTAHRNDYDCAEVPGMLRELQKDHINREGWDDLGYNFLVDRCGTIYEGRAGGIDRPVHGAHTKGFNADSVGIAVVGSFGSGAAVPQRVVDAVGRLSAWKLRPGANPRGTVRLVSTSGQSRYSKGDAAEFDVISGHRDSYHTNCPGEALYELLPNIRSEAVRLRSRHHR
jgi:hypothetical protein